MLLPLLFLVVTAAPEPPLPPPIEWEDLPEELERTAEGGIDVCEAASMPLSLVPGVGDAVGTVSEWLCLVPAAIAVDTVAVHFGQRDALFWQSAIALLVQKLFEDLIDTPLEIVVVLAAIAAVGAIVGSALIGLYLVPGFPIFLPTLVAIGVGTFLIAPVVFVKKKGGEWIFRTIMMALTNRVYGAELDKKRRDALVKPGEVPGWVRPYVLMTTAAGSEAEDDPLHFIPVAGRLFKAADEGRVTKERMRRVGRDLLMDKPGRDLTAMDTTIDTLAGIKGVTGAVGQGLALVGLGVGLAGAAGPPLKLTDQQTGDTIGFVGLGIAVAGLGLYAMGSTVDTIKTFAVPCAYGCFEPEADAKAVPLPPSGTTAPPPSTTTPSTTTPSTTPDTTTTPTPPTPNTTTPDTTTPDTTTPAAPDAPDAPPPAP